jgi:hypothetical protein
MADLWPLLNDKGVDPRRSRFGKLVAYLLDPQGKKTRVWEVTITNCVTG